MHKFQVVVLFFVGLLCSGVPCQADNTNSLQVEISTDKEVYLLHEPIWLDVRVINSSDIEERICLFGLADGTVKIDITSTNGTILEYTGPKILTNDRNDQILSPADTIYVFFELSEAYGVQGIEGKKGIPCGTYSVKANIVGGFESESIQLKVKEPSGLAETAHDLYISAISSQYADSPEEAMRDIRSILEISPATPYVEVALFTSIQILTFSQELGSIADPCIELLERIPNTGYADYVIFTLNNNVGKDSTRSVVESVLSKGHHPRLEVMVERIREKGEL